MGQAIQQKMSHRQREKKSFHDKTMKQSEVISTPHHLRNKGYMQEIAKNISSI